MRPEPTVDGAHTRFKKRFPTWVIVNCDCFFFHCSQTKIYNWDKKTFKLRTTRAKMPTWKKNDVNKDFVEIRRWENKKRWRKQKKHTKKMRLEPTVDGVHIRFKTCFPTCVIVDCYCFFFYVVVERKYIIETKETFKLRTTHAKMLTWKKKWRETFLSYSFCFDIVVKRKYIIATKGTFK